VLGEIRFAVGGVPAPHRLEPGAGGRSIAEIDLVPGGADPHGPLQIDFEVETVLRPCDLGDSADERRLGVAIGAVELSARP
jgi:hypothetical protein